MSAYAKTQERRVKKLLEDMDNVDIIRYFGAQEKNCGDLLVRVWGCDKRIRIDHKSTRALDSIKVDLKWLEKLEMESKGLEDADGECICIITFSIFDHDKVYVMSRPMLDKYPTIILLSRGKTKEVKLRDLIEAIGYRSCMCIWLGSGCLDKSKVHIYALETFIEGMRRLDQ